MASTKQVLKTMAEVHAREEELRGSTAVMFAYYVGAEVEQVLNLQWSDVALDAAAWKCPWAASNTQSQWEELSVQAAELLHTAAKHAIHGSHFIFCDKNGQKVQDWRDLRERIMRGAGIPDWYTGPEYESFHMQ